MLHISFCSAREASLFTHRLMFGRADVCSIEDFHAELELIMAHREERQALNDLWFSLFFIGARPI